MTNKHVKNFIRNLRQDDSAKLTPDERLNLRTELFANLGLPNRAPSAAPSAETEKALRKPVKSPFANRWEAFFVSSRIRISAVAVLVFVLASGGITFAAEQALPGDILYPIKTQVNENIVRAVKSVSPQAKAEFEVRMVDRRLKEAEQVEQREAASKLNAQIKTDVIVQSVRAKQALDKVEFKAKTESPKKDAGRGDNKDSPRANMKNDHGDHDDNNNGDGRKGNAKAEEKLNQVFEKHQDLLNKWEKEEKKSFRNRNEDKNGRGNQDKSN